MKLRTAELRLLVFPAAIAIVGFWTLAIATARQASLDVADLRTPAIVALSLLAVSLLWSATGFRGDQVLFPVVAAIAVLGLVMLHRLQPDLTRRDEGLAGVASRQVIFVLAGIAVAMLVARLFSHWWILRRYRYTLLLLCILLLLVTFVFGEPINGARLWITIGPVQAQPSEVIKIGLVLFLAAFLDDNRDVIERALAGRPAPPAAAAVPVADAHHVGNRVARSRRRKRPRVGAPALRHFPRHALRGHRPAALRLRRSLHVRPGQLGRLPPLRPDRLRVQNWLDPWQDPLGGGYQQVQSDYAVASGGLLGDGLGRGQPWHIPEVQTDFIFSAIAEETGAIGTLALLALFVVVMVRGFTIALQSPDGYLRLVAIGLSATLGLQTVIILGGVVRLIPLTGITLPFISYGGSSLLTNFLIVGMLLSISASSARTLEKNR